MAEKSFGVKNIQVQGSGTPTIESPDGGNLNITAANSTFSGDITLSSGKITGNGSGLTNVAAQALIGTSNIVAGINTTSSMRVGGDTSFSEDLVVTGNARVTGILTVGTGSLTITDRDVNTAGIIMNFGNVRSSGKAILL